MTFTFKKWKAHHYDNDRPVEPYSESENAEQWAMIAYYTEDKLQEAFVAGRKIRKRKMKFLGIVKRMLAVAFVFYIMTNMALGYTSGDQTKVIFCGFCLVLFELALILGKQGGGIT